jgi:MYXO-CTERM domain-containing protein
MSTMVLTFAIALVSSASADRIQGPPHDCPRGTRGMADHLGPYCTPIACTSDADCEGPAVCGEVALCSEVVTGSAGRGDVERSRTEVFASCDGAATCERGECNRTRVCVSSPAGEPSMNEPIEAPAMNEPEMNEPAIGEPSTNESAATNESDSSCSAGPAGAGLAVALGIVALLFVRRRRA